MWTFLFIVAFCHDFVWSETLRKIPFHEYCGSVIEDTVGDLQFDADELPSYLPENKCSVSVLPRHGSQVMFYFEEFELSIYCEDTNLTVTHGDVYEETTVPGLPKFMCGRNSTLVQKDQNFTASKDKLTFTYSFNEYGKRFYGTFRIKFLQFHTGRCDDDNEFRCSNDHCVDKEYQCSEEIRACPMNDQDCETDESVGGIVNIIINAAKNIGWIVIIAVVIYTLRIFYPKFKPHILECFRRNCTQEHQTYRADSDSHQSVQIEMSVCDHTGQLVPPDQTSQHSNTDSNQQALTSSDSESSVQDLYTASIDDTSSSLDLPVPNAPPPSYDDVMSNNIT